MSYSLQDRILGSLVAAGMGDAMGAPTETYSRREIIAHFGGYVEKFEDPKDNPLVVGNITAEVTDDASQMFELAKAVAETGGHLTVEATARAIVRWSESYPKYYPRNAGPTTSRVIDDLRAGKDPVVLGQTGGFYGRGTSNGAAMRVAACGLCNPGDLDGAVNTAITSCVPTHGTQHAYSGAAAISAAIAEALTEQATVETVVEAAIYGCLKGEIIGEKEARPAYGPYCLPLLHRALAAVDGAENMEEAIIQLDRNIGCNVDIQPTVACAVALFKAARGDWKKTILGGANLGGDTDTVACIAGMIAGAFCGFAEIDQQWYRTFKAANPALDLEAVAAALAAL